jgi:phage baseplate assembly protein W
MAIKDFSILLEKVSTISSNKDLGVVSGFNAYSQYITAICKTQKGELVSNMDLGSDYFKYIFNGQANNGALELSLSAYIYAAIPELANVQVQILYMSDSVIQLLVTYLITDGINTQNKASTYVEVQLQ